MPIGPAPVTSTWRGSQKARARMTATSSQALATTVVGSSSTPRMPSEGSSLVKYPGSIRQRSDMNPSISLMPRSVYCPLRHMSHSPTAQLGQGTGSGRRTIPTIRSPACRPLRDPGSTTRPSDSWPRISRSRPGGAQPYAPEAISTSVPQMPTATASTRIDPVLSSGSGTSSYRTDPATPGSTVTAFMTPHPDVSNFVQCGRLLPATPGRWARWRAHAGQSSRSRTATM